MVAAEGLSFLAFVYPKISLPVLLLAGIATFWISLQRLEWGLYILFGELFIGSRGHLLETGFISLRLVIFVAVFMAWVSTIVIQRPKAEESPFYHGIPRFARNDKIGVMYWLLLIVVAMGVLIGYLDGNGLRNVFFDANGYLYLLILPAVLAGIRTREAVESLFKILAAAILVIAAKTLILFLWFTYGFAEVAVVYHWIIERDIGEITGIVGSASRIFMQSQFWALVGIFIFTLPFPLPSREGNLEKGSSPLVGEVRWGVRGWLVISAALLSVILSLSRSFWLGGMAAGIFVVAVVIFRYREQFRSLVRLGGILILIVALELGGLYVITRYASGNISESVASRIGNPVQEAAGGARLLLLPELLKEIKRAPLWGSGFGKEVTYKSYLPDRIRPDNPDGEITSFAFEWGYLDTMLKVGLIGLLVYLFFIARIFKLGWKKLSIIDYRLSILGILSGLVALVVLNITTPYLNHPLGIGYLILCLLTFKVSHPREEGGGEVEEDLSTMTPS